LRGFHDWGAYRNHNWSLLRSWYSTVVFYRHLRKFRSFEFLRNRFRKIRNSQWVNWILTPWILWNLLLFSCVSLSILWLQEIFRVLVQISPCAFGHSYSMAWSELVEPSIFVFRFHYNWCQKWDPLQWLFCKFNLCKKKKKRYRRSKKSKPP
jgi:hypothetical protein